jgi:hypothetical protein
LFPRLGVLHFTLAMVFVPFGAPQAGSIPAPARTAAPAASPGIAATARRAVGALTRDDLLLSALRREFAGLRYGTPQN